MTYIFFLRIYFSNGFKHFTASLCPLDLCSFLSVSRAGCFILQWNFSPNHTLQHVCLTLSPHAFLRWRLFLYYKEVQNIKSSKSRAALVNEVTPSTWTYIIVGFHETQLKTGSQSSCLHPSLMYWHHPKLSHWLEKKSPLSNIPFCMFNGKLGVFS